jgi:hypothetical protein
MNYLAYIALHILTLFHSLIWIFFVFGCLFSKTIAKLNLFIILPFIYFSYLNNQHPFVILKLILLRKYYKDLPDVPVDFDEKDFNQTEYEDALIQLKILEDNLSSQNKLTSEEKRNILVYYQKLEKLYVDGSFQNPLTPQGLLILGAILSAYTISNKSPITIVKNILSKLF